MKKKRGVMVKALLSSFTGYKRGKQDTNLNTSDTNAGIRHIVGK